MIANKAAFIHIPKTAGLYVHQQLSTIFRSRGFKVHKIAATDEARFRDPHRGFRWTEEELIDISRDTSHSQLVRNHSPAWTPRAFREFKNNGWFTFAFTRHPGDQLCSLYHFSRERYGLYQDMDLNTFVRTRLEGADNCWHLPPFWRMLDYVREFTDKNFAEFLKTYFNAEPQASEPINESKNLGFEHYCETGEISFATRAKLERSPQFSDFLATRHNQVPSRTRSKVLKAAFIHVPKTAGSYVQTCLNAVCKRMGFTVHAAPSENGKARDWTDTELVELSEFPARAQFLHNHSHAWSERAFHAFKDKGWFTFAFTRHPGDMICSHYFYGRAHYGIYADMDLDTFVRAFIQGKDDSWRLPPYWREIDYIREFTEANFAEFMKEHFGHSHEPRAKSNESSNGGFNYYCEAGLISAETQALVERSRDHRDFLEIRSAGVPAP